MMQKIRIKKEEKFAINEESFEENESSIDDNNDSASVGPTEDEIPLIKNDLQEDKSN